jgi:hypothetical protein
VRKCLCALMVILLLLLSACTETTRRVASKGQFDTTIRGTMYFIDCQTTVRNITSGVVERSQTERVEVSKEQYDKTSIGAEC